jgi:ABC-type transporter Mla maintaining outer membrane lipid asymmetry permease subunit MlaE
MALTRQILALEALGIPRTRYLWAPAWVGLGISFLAGAAVFAAGLLAGGLLLCAVDGVPNGWEILGSDLFDPAPDRAPYTVRAGWLIWIYAWGIASDAVARGSAHKDTSESVTAAMTKSVVASTLWVVFLELTSVFILFAVQRVGP